MKDAGHKKLAAGLLTANKKAAWAPHFSKVFTLMGATQTLVLDANLGAKQIIKGWTTKAFVPKEKWEFKTKDLEGKENVTPCNDRVTLKNWLDKADKNKKFYFGGSCYNIITYDKENKLYFVASSTQPVKLSGAGVGDDIKKSPAKDNEAKDGEGRKACIVGYKCGPYIFLCQLVTASYDKKNGKKFVCPYGIQNQQSTFLNNLIGYLDPIREEWEE